MSEKGRSTDCIAGVAIARAALLAAAAAALALILVSGGSDADPRTPPALPGLPPPFLGTAVSGDGGLTAAIDAYGDVVDLRAPGPAGRALVDNPAARQVAGTVPEDTGIVPMLRVGPDGDPEPLWEGESVRQHYLHGTNVVETVGFVQEARLIVRTAVVGDSLAMTLIARSSRQGRALPAISVDVEEGIDCAQAERAGVLELLCRVGRALPPDLDADSRELSRECDRVVRDAGGAHRWVALARELGAGAPRWARAMYDRSLLVLHALTDRRSGAVAAGARDGWAYVWPRDAATAALAYAAAGYRNEARRVAGFLSGLGSGVERAARFDGAGASVPGRGPQGDAAGWIAVASAAPPARPSALDFLGAIATQRSNARNLPDYQEGSPGTYLGNAIADGVTAARIAAEFETPRGLVREAGNPSSGLDSAAAWAVRPFASPSLYPAVRRTLLNLAGNATPYGITPGEGWAGGVDPWTAPTAWSAWSLAALGDRAAALRLLADLRRAATPAGAMPERVDASTGVPRSTTPLLWSHAFAILALRQLWPSP